LSSSSPIIRLWNGSARAEIVRWGVIDPTTRETDLVRRAQRSFAYRCLVPIAELTVDRGGGHLLTVRSERNDWLMAAGVWKPMETFGVAGFSLLTCEAGPDLAPMMSDAPLVIDEDHWADWIDSTVDVPALIHPASAGTFVAELSSKWPSAA
jgi:putative SOS response-associated peptidase YedK